MAIKRKVTVDGESFEVELEKIEDAWKVSIDGSQFEVQIEQERGSPKREGRSRNSSSRSGNISSPIPGKVVSIHVSVGDQVEEGAVLLILEAMKMQLSLIHI